MPTRLNWVYQDHARTPEYRASYKGLTLRAIHDDCPENPFENWDGNWPIVVRSPDAFRGFTCYDKGSDGADELLEPLARFNDAVLVHMQVHVAKVLHGPTVAQLMETYSTEEPTAYCRDAEVLRDTFEQALSDTSESHRLEAVAELYKLIGISATVETARGYSQGDWSEILVVALPERVAEFYGEGWAADTEEAKARLAKDMERTASLYGYWAYGDVYGYIVEDRDGVELGSCWGFYGDEFDESGLEEAAMDCAEGCARAAIAERLAKLKQLIRARVPLILRADILGELRHV